MARTIMGRVGNNVRMPLLFMSGASHLHPAKRFCPQRRPPFQSRRGYREGADSVWSTDQDEAAIFETGSEARFEILRMGATDGSAYWVGIQQAIVGVSRISEAIPMNLRVTEILRPAGGWWKMIHRHAGSVVTDSRANRK